MNFLHDIFSGRYIHIMRLICAIRIEFVDSLRCDTWTSSIDTLRLRVKYNLWRWFLPFNIWIYMYYFGQCIISHFVHVGLTLIYGSHKNGISNLVPLSTFKKEAYNTELWHFQYFGCNCKGNETALSCSLTCYLESSETEYNIAFVITTFWNY
jgi:hypothetical protein